MLRTAYVLGAMERLAEAWTAFDRREPSRCPMTIAMHKGEVRAFRSHLSGRDLNIVSRMAGAAESLIGETSAFASGPVREDVVGTPWDARLERLDVTLATPRARRILDDVAVYRLRCAASR